MVGGGFKRASVGATVSIGTHLPYIGTHICLLNGGILEAF